VLRSFAGLLRVDPGFEPADTVGLNVSTLGPRYAKPEAVRAFYAALLERVRAAPGVESAALTSNLPMTGNWDRSGFHIEDRPVPSQEAPEVDRTFVSDGYFGALRVPIVRGRGFEPADRADSAPVAVVSAALAQRYWPDADPIGRRIQLGARDESRPWATIVGVAGDVRQYAPDVAPAPQA
jgi:hypothetical protein